MVAVFEIVELFGVAILTFTSILNEAVSVAATVAFEKVTVPVPPTAGDEVLHPIPVFTAADTKVVLAGSVSLTWTD